MTRDRLLYIDVVKILACFLVIVNHTNSSIFLSLNPSSTWVASLTYFFISKPAVPLFLIASGAIMLNHNYNYKDILKKTLRMIIVLILFSLLYYFIFQTVNMATFKQFIIDLPNKPITNAYWYLYLYTAILMMLPILANIAASLNGRACRYLITLTLILGFIEIVSHYVPVLEINDYFHSAFFSAFIVTFLSGFYLKQYSLESKKSVITSIGIISGIILFLVLATYNEYLQNPEDYLFFDNRNSPFILVLAGLTFLLVKYTFAHIDIGTRLSKIITTIGKTTFGIYLLSDLFIKKLSFAFDFFNGILHPMIAMILFELIIFSAGFFVSYSLRLIPFIKKLI